MFMFSALLAFAVVVLIAPLPLVGWSADCDQAPEVGDVELSMLLQAGQAPARPKSPPRRGPVDQSRLQEIGNSAGLVAADNWSGRAQPFGNIAALFDGGEVRADAVSDRRQSATLVTVAGPHHVGSNDSAGQSPATVLSQVAVVFTSSTVAAQWRRANEDSKASTLLLPVLFFVGLVLAVSAVLSICFGTDAEDIEVMKRRQYLAAFQQHATQREAPGLMSERVNMQATARRAPLSARSAQQSTGPSEEERGVGIPQRTPTFGMEPEPEEAWGDLEVVYSVAPQTLGLELMETPGSPGVHKLSVHTTSPEAAERGWRAGDVIMKVNGVEIIGRRQFLRELDKAKELALKANKYCPCGFVFLEDAVCRKCGSAPPEASGAPILLNVWRPKPRHSDPLPKQSATWPPLQAPKPLSVLGASLRALQGSDPERSRAPWSFRPAPSLAEVSTAASSDFVGGAGRQYPQSSRPPAPGG